MFDKYIEETNEELKQFIRELAVIPAPSHHEEKRAAFVKAWMEKNGAEGVYIDEALNVIWPINVTDDNDLYVFMAHTDVVFPDTTPLPFREDEDRFYCPGVGDDTGCLAVLLHSVRYFTKQGIKPKTGLLIVANSCEEGLGNLKGSRRIIDDFMPRVKGLITVDGSPGSIVTRAVGSHRYRVTVKTEGGHSWGSFGNRNAIACLSSLISSLYSVKVPSKPDSRTTYNVGIIEGGTSVNTIAQEASMMYEYRSNDIECLGIMKNMFEKMIEGYRATGITVNVELLGERPCGVELDKEEYEKFLKPFIDAESEVNGKEPARHAGSTDCNYPLSKGIPAVCIGGCKHIGCHTREEYLVLSSLPTGMKIVMTGLASFFEGQQS